MSSMRLDPQFAAELDLRLWERLKASVSKDKDLSAAVDILKFYANTNYMTTAHGEAAKEILAKPMYQPAGAAPATAQAPTSRSEDPANILARLSAGGMLRGKNGEKAMDLLGKASRWSSAQAQYARDLAAQIRDSALIYNAIDDALAEHESGFLSSLHESFDEWGTYTPKQMSAAVTWLENLGISDPRNAAHANPDQLPLLADTRDQGAPQPQRPAEQPRGREDDDIPF